MILKREPVSEHYLFFFSSGRVKIRHQFSQNTLFKQNKKDVKFCARLWKNRGRCFFVLSRKWDKETAPDPHGTRTLVDSIPPEDFFPCPRSSQDEKMSFSDYFCCCFICLFVLVYAERDRNSSYASFPALINWICFCKLLKNVIQRKMITVWSKTLYELKYDKIFSKFPSSVPTGIKYITNLKQIRI